MNKPFVRHGCWHPQPSYMASKRYNVVGYTWLTAEHGVAAANRIVAGCAARACCDLVQR